MGVLGLIGWGVAGLIGLSYLWSCFPIVAQWERAVVLRFGKFNRVLDPGGDKK